MNIISGFLALVLMVAVVAIYRQGKTSARASVLEAESDAVAEAQKWRDRLRYDGDLVRRLRARFRRDVLPPL